MVIQNETYIMNNYGTKPEFSSFLPGIAGVHGIPIWCYYVNRGQGIASFGVNNKDHAIMEFYPAHMAYRNVKRTGFRTFIKQDDRFREIFEKENPSQQMRIHMNLLELEEKDEQNHLSICVQYYVLPQEKVGALVRCLTIRNTGNEPTAIQVLDGMPELIPYGVNMDSMKNMTQTAKAWMQVENLRERVPYYRVRASMDDSAEVQAIEGGNFAMAYDADGQRLQPIVDPKVIFDYDNSLTHPIVLENGGLQAVYEKEQNVSNLLPCAFWGKEAQLLPGEDLCINEIIGQVESKDTLFEYLKKNMNANYFQMKQTCAVELAEKLCEGIATHTASDRFDAYCKYTYMDNVLRGGYPMLLGNNKVYYVYSRKHGDLERDYNYFSMLPEYYSQGNGNYRDVNQNRRCDNFFAPYVGTRNIQMFYNLIQLDGYNPLGVEMTTYRIPLKKLDVLILEYPSNVREQIRAIVRKPFTPGRLYRELELLIGDDAESLFTHIIDFSEETVNGNFLEGYWSDHWTYNLDLIQEYLCVFPDREKEMLYENTYTWFLSQVNVNRRGLRYQNTSRGIRQYKALNEESRRKTKEKLVREEFGKGKIAYSTLLEKLILLCAVKFATLDAYGMGVEMEGGKPGWYDALNGMPGMFGSSMAETYELKRMLNFTIQSLEKYPETINLFEEVHCFVEELNLINSLEQKQIQTEKQVLSFWNRINDAKEIYREKTYEGVSGKKISSSSVKLAEILKTWEMTVAVGIEKAKKYGTNQIPTYFTFEVTNYEEIGNEIRPLEFRVCPVPDFLEGTVRYLKTGISKGEGKQIYTNVKNGELYDTKLKMYKVNAPMENASYELGRAKAFTPGWLENESIWLHMEYKYLLELLKNGLYDEFAEDFQTAAVPFLDAEQYGRSILENSSFIASSRNPDKSVHGRGFVARLSGSTIEFISMWKIIMFGEKPFVMNNHELCCKFQPAIPKYLIPEDGIMKARFLSDTRVEYHFSEQKSYYPGEYEITQMSLIYENGTKAEICGEMIKGQQALDLRAGKIDTIIAWIN